MKGKVLAIIERGGTAGITKTEIVRALRPKPATHELVEVIGELGEQGAIVWGEMRKDARSRPGTRLFASAVGLPKVHDDGTMYFRE